MHVVCANIFGAIVLKPRFKIDTHCEKSLFVLASRQKIPVLRKENPAVNTRTIPPIEFFKITHARKATAGKYRPETTDTAGKSRPSGARKGKAGKSRQVTTDTAGKFACQ